MLGISTLTSYGINAAVFGMVAHGLITGMLFFLAGSIGERYGTREIKRLGGLLVQAPQLGWILGFCAMASLGLPGLAGFWGEFPAILSSFDPSSAVAHHLGLYRAYMVIAAVGTVLAAGYLLWMFQRVAFGTPKPEFEKAHIHDVHVPEWLAWTPILVLIAFFGIYPHALFKTTDGAVNQATINVPAPVNIVPASGAATTAATTSP
jgi:NADH-quinone oxidoreductase subunit M